jgi:hypothetical protein
MFVLGKLTMKKDDHKFRVVEKHIPNVVCQNEGLLGIVKIQMPEQCDESAPFRIRDRERARNIKIVKNAIKNFGKWSQQVNAPAIILFPELSVTEEAVDWLRGEMATPQVSPNTLIVLGLEQLTTKQFRTRVAASDSQAEFASLTFPPNIDLINTAVMMAKNNSGEVSCFYQPKCSRSGYESPRQFTSRTVYELTFGSHTALVTICSDFLLRDGSGTLVGSVLEDMKPRPRDHRLDLILLIQKNPNPFHSLYNESVKQLFYNRPHQVHTTDTIICAVNSIDTKSPGKFGKSNTSVMRRGRPPKELKTRPAVEHYAWCSITTNEAHDNEDLHYARWRIRCAGAISFILDTDRRPWVPNGLESVPVQNPGLHRINDAGQFEIITPVPEVYELQEALYHDFQIFIDKLFHAKALSNHLGTIPEYERLLHSLFTRSPRQIMRLLLTLHEASVNCDHWNPVLLENVFKHFLVVLRLLSEGFTDFAVVEDYLRADTQKLGIMDCGQKSITTILDHLQASESMIHDIDLLLVQQMGDLHFWDGKPKSLEALINLVSTSRVTDEAAVSTSVARAPSPRIANRSED